MILSMTDGGKPYQNPIVERNNGILKHEFDLKNNFETLQKLKIATKNAINIYNNYRLHASLNYSTPNKIHNNLM